MTILEKDYPWLSPVLTFFVSIILFLFTYWSVSDDFYIREMFFFPITYIYLIYFNGTVYVGKRISKYMDNFSIRDKPHLRITIELVFLCILSFLFFYISIVLLGIINEKENPFQFRKQEVVLALNQCIVLLLYSSLAVTDDFLRKWRTSSLQIAELKQEKLKVENRALQSQLNPHFLFNSLNVLVSEIDYDPQSAKTFVLDLSNIYRYVLDSKDKELVPLKEEWEFMKRNIRIHQVRLGDGLLLKENIDSTQMELKIPPLALQLLLENCFKHNTATVRKPLTIEIEVKDGFISVINNKQLKPQKPQSHKIGLTFLKEAYKNFLDGEVVVEENEEYFKVKVPLIDEKQ
ncbi:histidine kinase [Flammeovirga sp. MY04]|uniref:sensor histidine kinase n=1 Tax=Flammeovirga sp. MY04 TaxID=1191459 RepID=UPI0008061095|nr:histidine kinase [Flammeovirga sp. MY04]ANQ52425.1 histidine kinase [Flammeovirga sp. MY04]